MNIFQKCYQKSLDVSVVFLALENVDFQEEDYHFFLNETSVLNAIPQIKRLNA